MQFVFQPLAWGFLLVALPLLIHLINLIRHRRTQWAAMEFLLESYRKHRRWVWLRQAILLASRMLAIAIAVAMLAQWISGSKWLAMISQSTTHHYVILDDSASMGDAAGNASAYQSAIKAIHAIASSTGSQEGAHLLSILRTSRASLATGNKKNEDNGSKPQVDSVADMLGRTIPSDPTSLLSAIGSTTPTSIDTDISQAIGLLPPLIEQAKSERSIVYLMTDVRSKDWSNPALIKQQLQAIPNSDLELQIIDCAPERHDNLSIVSVQPQQEVLAAGVPLMINVTVRNNGAAPVRDVAVRVAAIDYSDRQIEPKEGEAYSGQVTNLPPLVFDSIEPGVQVSRHIQVLFPKSGSHVIEAQLPPDSLAADNVARCVLDLQDGLHVLLIDGDSSGKHSFFFESALNPGGNTKTGLIMSREGPSYLRDSDQSALQTYACIILQAIPALDERALENLHRYIASGGGAALFFGDALSSADYLKYNSLWTKVSGSANVKTPLLPFSLNGPTELKAVAGDTAPDLIPENHPIFGPLFGQSNSPFQFVRIQRYVAIDEPQSTDRASTNRLWKSVATLRNGQPLLVDHSIGDGRLLIGLTSLEPKWTDWHRDPTFVVTALQTVGYLASFRTPDTWRTAGTPMRWDFSSQLQLPEVEVLTPAMSGSVVRPKLDINAVPAGDSTLAAILSASTNDVSENTLRAVTSAGNFEWWGSSTQAGRVVRNMARNTPAVEGELEKTSPADLNRVLRGVRFIYKTSDSLGNNLSLASFANRNMLLMALLLGLLLFEQWLAWSASYHLVKK